MSLFTIRPELRTNRKNKDGESPVSICVTIQRKRTYHSTGISLLETQWDNAKGRVKASVQNAAASNVRIGNEISRIQRELLAAADAGGLSGNIGKVKVKTTTEFYQYADAIITRYINNGQESTARRNKAIIPSIRNYAGNRLNLSDIDYAWLKGYHAYCATDLNPRRKGKVKIDVNTISLRFKFLRMILLEATNEGIIEKCPLGKTRGGYPMPTYTEKPKDYLTLTEVDSLLGNLGNKALSKHEDMVLAFFLIECTSGIRHSDWSRFATEKLIEGNALKVRTKKTGEPVYVPIGKNTRLSKVLSYIDKKGYDYTDTETVLANRALKILAKVAGIPKAITTHTGRHTAATLYLEKGFSREAVAEILGVSMKVIDTYAKMTRLKVRNEFEKFGGL